MTITIKRNGKTFRSIGLHGMAGKNAFLSNLNKTDLWTFKPKDKFVKEIVEIWIEINFLKQLRSTNEY